jgi:tripartite-type tricarboxylate transporter receptor subunit TctC
LAAAPNADAAEYPTRPIKLVVPYAAGGPTDVLGRLLGEFLGRDLKQAVIVENKAGAQGAIAAEAVARAEPDGYTLFVTAASIIVLNPMLYKKLSYDPVRDFRMLALITDLPVVMEVHPSLPVKTVAEFVAFAKANPGKLNFGSAGTGSTIHLAGEMFKQIAGVDMVHVAYKGAGPALTDLLSGNIQVMFDSLGAALPPVKAGLLRPLGVSSDKRISDLPDVPTIAESGYPDYRVSVWFGVAAPAKLADDIAKKVSASIDRALNDDAFRASLEKIGYPPLRPRSAAAITEFIDADRARWAAVIKAQNISLD